MLSVDPGTFAAHVEVVIAKICSCPDCKRQDDLDGNISFCLSYKDPNDNQAKEHFFFIPHPLHADGFTVAQVEEIEGMLMAIGFDLMPLDPNLVH